jgi:hypothetical protein
MQTGAVDTGDAVAPCPAIVRRMSFDSPPAPSKAAPWNASEIAEAPRKV